MQSVADRRTFVRQLAVVVPVIATTSVPRLADAAGTAGHQPADLPADLNDTLKELVRLHNELRHRRPTAADARLIGARIRSVATYQLHQGRDVALADSVRTLVERDGTAALVSRVPDLDMMRRELAAFGFERPLETLGATTAEDRDAALARLIRGGLTSMYLESGLTLEMIALTATGGYCDTLRE